MRRFAALALLSLLVLALCVPLAQAEPRVALVIGNGAYKAGPLKNPVNDARDMAAALRELGFEVILRENAGLAQMEQAVDQFWTSLKKGGTGLFFFAGHGLQVKGVNYLVPVDANIQVEQDVKVRCLDVNLVLGRMENAGNPLNLVILDACRNNPFARAWRNAGQGLAKMDAPMGTLIAYATAPDSVAADGAGRNGVYTSHLLQRMRTPGLKVEDVLKQTRIGVIRETDKRQIPWESSSLTGDFYFKPGAGGQAPPAALAQPVAPQPVAPQTSQPLALAPAPKAPPPPEPKAGDTWRDPTTDMEFVWVPTGCFTMGSPSDEAGHEADEAPQHEVCVTGLWVGKYHVTRGEFRKYIADTGKKTDAEIAGSTIVYNIDGVWSSAPGFSWKTLKFDQDDRHPVVAVSWNDAKEFASWLSAKGNGGFRLLTEAEYEYASRSGSTTARFWEASDDPCVYANVCDLSYKRKGLKATDVHGCDDGYAFTAPVDAHKHNSYGLFGMLGNAFQWCEDVYKPDAYKSHYRMDPLYDGTGEFRVTRGGSWDSKPKWVRAANRGYRRPSYSSDFIGFRLVRVP